MLYILSFGKKFYTKHTFRVIGSFFLVVQLIILSALLFSAETRPFLFWLCNNFSLLLALACFRGDLQMLKGISYVGLVTQLLWIADFVSHMFGFNLSGITDYISVEGFTYANNVSIILHVSVPLVALVLTYKIKPQIRSLYYAVPYIFVLFVGTFLWTPPSEDINCVFQGCNLLVYFKYHIVLWPLYAGVAMLLGYGVHYLLYIVWTSYSTSISRTEADVKR